MSQNGNGTGNAAAYNDNSIPFGGIGVNTPVSFYRGQTTPQLIGIYLVESVTPQRPTKVVERPDQIGGPNGWAAVRAQGGGTAKIQIATSATPFLQEGDYFTYTFDAVRGPEKYVITETSEPFEANSYWFQNTQLKRAYFT